MENKEIIENEKLFMGKLLFRLVKGKKEEKYEDESEDIQKMFTTIAEVFFDTMIKRINYRKLKNELDEIEKLL